jgi:5-methylcytosine-specific restriction protein A
MGRIKMAPPLVPKGDGRPVKPEPKQADPFYFRRATRRFATPCCRVLAIAANGLRITVASLIRRSHQGARDGGDAFDPNNGMCLCGSHHTIKTARQRVHRMVANAGRGGG